MPKSRLSKSRLSKSRLSSFRLALAIQPLALIAATTVVLLFPLLATVTHRALAADDNTPQKPAAKDPRRPVPSLDDAEKTQTFEDAVRLFDEEQWKTASKMFRDLKRNLQRDQGKLIDPWLDGCKGGKKLGKVQKAADKSRWAVAWAELEKIRFRYGNTALHTKLDSVGAAIAKELFLPLATFEADPPPLQSKSLGDGVINEDAKYVREGKRSLKWDFKVGFNSGKLVATLPIADVKGALLDEYRYLRLSLYSPDDKPAKIAVFFNTEESFNGNPLQTKAFYKYISVFKSGWMDLRFDLYKELESYSSPVRAEIKSLSLLAVPPSKAKTVYIDNVRFERK